MFHPCVLVAVLKSRKNTKKKSKWALKYNFKLKKTCNNRMINNLANRKQETRFHLEQETLKFVFQKETTK